jgi:uncharacterized glyoxalase superfamily protein PhnB
MTGIATTTVPIAYPALTYRHTEKVIGWLERAFGFRRHVVYKSDDGKVMHAEIACGAGLVMMGDVKDDSTFGKLVRPPGEAGVATQSIYVAVPDSDAVFAMAKAAGAQIVMGLTDQPYGSRDFICKDPEGHVWCFGTYAPRT